jgi:type II secretory pathway pseudopilin PulG
MTRKSPAFAAGEPKLSGFGLAHNHSEQAFTLTELVVVLATIAILSGLLLPALAATHDRSRRSVCQDHLRQIGVAMTLYAGENNGNVVPVQNTGGVYVPVAINVLSSSALNQIGLSLSDTNLNGSCIWTCPNRPSLPLYVPFAPQSQWIIGYQYFGGIATWNTPLGSFPSRSPTNFWHVKPYWTLAADANIRDDVAWGHLNNATGGGAPYWDNIPPHRTSDASFPQGGNQVFCDGSVQWIDFEKMYGLIRWIGVSGARTCYFYQDQIDFDPRITQAVLKSIRAQP